MIGGMRRNRNNLVKTSEKRLSLLLIIGGVLFATACFLKAMPDSPPRAEAVEESATHDTSQEVYSPLGYRTKKIEDIRVGDRVLADNPDVASPAETQVDPATWRKLSLRAEQRWSDGTIDDINVETLQPPEWLAMHNVRIGAAVPLPLDLVEMGLSGNLRGQVASIDPCPAIRPGSGRVVLTTVNHLNACVLELSVRDNHGHTETIRPTGFHKFYRPDERTWISAEELRSGDTLLGVNGFVSIVSATRVPGTHRVFNLTVEADHVYRVSQHGVLVHNENCWDFAQPHIQNGGQPLVITADGTGQFGLIPDPPGYPVAGQPPPPFFWHVVVINDGTIYDPAFPDGISADHWVELYGNALDGVSILPVMPGMEPH